MKKPAISAWIICLTTAVCFVAVKPAQSWKRMEELERSGVGMLVMAVVMSYVFDLGVARYQLSSDSLPPNRTAE